MECVSSTGHPIAIAGPGGRKSSCSFLDALVVVVQSVPNVAGDNHITNSIKMQIGDNRILLFQYHLFDKMQIGDNRIPLFQYHLFDKYANR